MYSYIDFHKPRTISYNFSWQELRTQVTDVLRHSQQYFDHINVKPILDSWFAAKRTFIDAMNGNLIYQYPELVTFELDEKSKKMRMEEFAEKIENYYANYSLSNFIVTSGINAFFNNLTEKEYQDNKTGITVPAKYKLIKAFKFFVDNEDSLKEIQNEASMIIQENTISGYLCFSVHPLDYLSISENTHNWRSCHALDGEYRSGNLNYMVDSSTVVCYLRAEKMAILPRFPENIIWNSKKWRVLLYFSNDLNMMFAGRQYPFVSAAGLDMVKDFLVKKVFKDTLWTSFHQPIIPNMFDTYSDENIIVESTMIPIGDSIVPIYKIVKDNPNTHQFNDLLRSSCYIPLYSYMYGSIFKTNPLGTGFTTSDTKVLVGGQCLCPRCNNYFIAHQEFMLCDHCLNEIEDDSNKGFECEICGNITPEEDGHWLVWSGLHVCHNCYEDDAYRCESCGLKDVPPHVRRYKSVHQALCPDCARRRHVAELDVDIAFEEVN